MSLSLQTYRCSFSAKTNSIVHSLYCSCSRWAFSAESIDCWWHVPAASKWKKHLSVQFLGKTPFLNANFFSEQSLGHLLRSHETQSVNLTTLQLLALKKLITGTNKTDCLFCRPLSLSLIMWFLRKISREIHHRTPSSSQKRPNKLQIWPASSYIQPKPVLLN